MQNTSSKSNLLVTLILGLSLATGCASPGKRTGIGAGIGAAAGAGIGAIAGGGHGALLGAGIGAVAGGVIGNRMDKQANELAEVAETKRTADGILVNLKNDLLFETGKSTLTSEANAQLAQLGAILMKYPKDHVTVAGHTDNIGSASNNSTLSLHRAQAVQDVLLQNGVTAGQLSVEGFGASKPLAENSSKAGRAKNRRVELYIVDTEAKR
ncbi:MAG: OmpA family protein [Bdellovibrionales bacterium]|nr:OmpA family protein [Oligoflexia bacterium]